jgi:hypothetical protein
VSAPFWAIKCHLSKRKKKSMYYKQGRDKEERKKEIGME